MAKFAQYALAATEEALEDAGWRPTREEDREATVGLTVIGFEGVLIFEGCLPWFGHWSL